MQIDQNIPLNDKNWFCTGGAAKYFCEPKTEQDFASALAFAKEKNIETFVLGLGANILISDAGFDGLVIRPALDQIKIDGDGNVCAGAGVKVQDLIDFCLDHNLAGLEEFSGIPGSVGGSVFINIHYMTYFLADFLVGARVIEKSSGHVLDVDKSWFNFGYDYSKLFDGQYFVVNATFKLKQCTDLETAYCKGRSDETIRHRNRRYPMSNTCGSFFRNFHESEVPFLINGKKLLFIAYYLDKLGIKGELAVGNAIVSHQHANMVVTNTFVTKPGATSADVINLAKKMQELVKEKFGVVPQVECQLVGFKQNPLV
jgi:UDP-N-acetylmuramate dehydrogenase